MRSPHHGTVTITEPFDSSTQPNAGVRVRKPEECTSSWLRVAETIDQVFEVVPGGALECVDPTRARYVARCDGRMNLRGHWHSFTTGQLITLIVEPRVLIADPVAAGPLRGTFHSEREVLELLGTPTRGQAYLIGRDSDIIPAPPFAGDVSRRHAQLVWDGAWTLEDLNSTHGTFINGRRLTPKVRQVVRTGDRLGFGGSVMVTLDLARVDETDLPFIGELGTLG